MSVSYDRSRAAWVSVSGCGGSGKVRRRSQSGECASSHRGPCRRALPLPGRGIPCRDQASTLGPIARRDEGAASPMPDSDAILTRLGLDPASMRDGDLEVRTPITGEPLARLRTATPDEVDAAVSRASAAFEAWRQVPAPRRGELVRLLGEELRREKEALGALVTLEAGKIVQEGLGEVQEMIDICDFAVGPVAAALRPDDRLGAARAPHVRDVAPARGRSASSPRSTSRWPCGAGTPRSRWRAATPSSGSRRRSRRSPPSRAGRSSSAPPSGSATRRRASSRSSWATRPRVLVDDPRLPLVSATGSTAMGRTIAPRIAGRLGAVGARARRQQRHDRRARPPTSTWRCGPSCSPPSAPPASAARRCGA